MIAVGGGGIRCTAIGTGTVGGGRNVVFVWRDSLGCLHQHVDRGRSPRCPGICGCGCIRIRNHHCRGVGVVGGVLSGGKVVRRQGKLRLLRHSVRR